MSVFAPIARRTLPLVVLLAVACDVNPYDPAQRPEVTVAQTAGSLDVTVSWRPAGAQLVRVYRGSVAGDGYGDTMMWSIASNTENSLVSGVTYGTVPTGGTTDWAARPLVAGETYTAEVTRRDPKGTGDGFTNTANRYVGTATFTVTAAAPAVR